jgi:hypothetical protein
VAKIDSHQSYAELLKEFRQKVEYLKRKYRFQQQQIAANIGEHPSNVTTYLNIRIDRPCSLRKLLTLLSRLNDHYAGELVESPEPVLDIHLELRALQNRLKVIHNLLIEMAGRTRTG